MGSGLQTDVKSDFLAVLPESQAPQSCQAPPLSLSLLPSACHANFCLCLSSALRIRAADSIIIFAIGLRRLRNLITFLYFHE